MDSIFRYMENYGIEVIEPSKIEISKFALLKMILQWLYFKFFMQRQKSALIYYYYEKGIAVGRVSSVVDYWCLK